MKYFKYTLYIAFAALMIVAGAFGKLTGADQAVTMFESINLFDQGEAFGRILVGLGELAAGIGIFFAITRKTSAVLGMALMAGAIVFVVNGTIGGSVVLPIITFAIALAIFIMAPCYKCGKGMCGSGTCKVTKEQ